MHGYCALRAFLILPPSVRHLLSFVPALDRHATLSSNSAAFFSAFSCVQLRSHPPLWLFTKMLQISSAVSSVDAATSLVCYRPET